MLNLKSFCRLLAAFISLMLIAATSSLAPQSRGQSGGTNTCKCDSPINSQATATGTCTRTQDDGTFCDLTFSVSQRAALASGSDEFKKYAAGLNLSIPSDSVGTLVAKLESGEVFGARPSDVAASLEAISALAAAQRPREMHAQTRFQDIFDMLTFKTPADENRKASVIRSLEWFATPIEKGSDRQSQTVTAKDKTTFHIVTTPGCIEFGESDFRFTVRVLGEAAQCDVRP